MNQRLQGWRLALALLIPAAILGGAGFLAYNALTDDDSSVATGDDATLLPLRRSATTPPETDPADPSGGRRPDGRYRCPPHSRSPRPQHLRRPQFPQRRRRQRPNCGARNRGATANNAALWPGAHGNPRSRPVVTVACSGTIPGSVEVGETFGPLTAVTTPPEAAANYQFVWDLGNSTTVTSPATGTISYTPPRVRTRSRSSAPKRPPARQSRPPAETSPSPKRLRRSP